MATKSIYRFSKDGADPALKGMDAKALKTLLGGKGAGLQTMSDMKLPVPPGFTITTEVCNAYRAAGFKITYLDEIGKEVGKHGAWLEKQFGFAPLVSVRSGAPISMPGMMDTILNVGLTSKNIEEWKGRIGERAALDSYRRLIQMLGETAYGVPKEAFEKILDGVKKAVEVEHDTDLNITHLMMVIDGYRKTFQAVTQKEFPDTLQDQLGAAIKAVFNSWMNERAIEYRKINNIDENMGTACTVQAMVFGNMGDDSGSGVLFTRDPSTGEKKILAEYLPNAQGEDVVAGIRTPQSIDFSQYMSAKGQSWADAPGAWMHNLQLVCETLEAEYKDMVDIEFTVQKGELFILQSRVGKRSAPAAFRIAVDLVSEGVIDVDTALSRLTRAQYKIIRRPTIDPKFQVKPDYVGLAACPGIGVGIIAKTSAEAVKATVPVVLTTLETTPDDIAGMHKSVGILTKTGGATSHAAVVARAMDKPCVVGCTNLDLNALQEGTKITVDGGTGRVWVGIDVPVIDVSEAPEINTVIDWCLQKTGWHEQTVIDKDGPGPQRIMAAHWFGDDDLFDAILEGLGTRDSMEGISLDLTPPSMLGQQVDHQLDHIFAPPGKADDDFFHVMIGKLLGIDNLNGLTLVSRKPLDQVAGALVQKGYQVSTEPHTLAHVMNNKLSIITPKFVQEVVGDQETWNKLKKLLEQDGVKFGVVADAVPPDYAVFTVLKS